MFPKSSVGRLKGAARYLGLRTSGREVVGEAESQYSAVMLVGSVTPHMSECVTMSAQLPQGQTAWQAGGSCCKGPERLTNRSTFGECGGLTHTQDEGTFIPSHGPVSGFASQKVRRLVQVQGSQTSWARTDLVHSCSPTCKACTRSQKHH